MFQDFLSAQDLGIFPTVALLIFLFCFTAVFAHLLLTRKDRFDRIAHLPLDDEENHAGGPGLHGRRTGR
jgi:cbb3-type cytochrome oxidase subunit 3